MTKKYRKHNWLEFPIMKSKRGLLNKQLVIEYIYNCFGGK